MCVKKFTSFCHALKNMHTTEKLVPFLLRHGVVRVVVTWTCCAEGPTALTWPELTWIADAEAGESQRRWPLHVRGGKLARHQLRERVAHRRRTSAGRHAYVF